MMYSRKEEEDWEVTANGLYVATRGYLIRRGYCCSNKCRNCPYINWRNDPEWQPLPAECIKRARVAPKSAVAAQALLTYHQQQLKVCSSDEVEHQTSMVEHYQTLLEHWGIKNERR